MNPIHGIESRLPALLKLITIRVENPIHGIERKREGAGSDKATRYTVRAMNPIHGIESSLYHFSCYPLQDRYESNTWN